MMCFPQTKSTVGPLSPAGKVSWVYVVALILVLGVNAKGCAAVPPSNEEVRKTSNCFEFRPGVIVDSHRSTMYLMNIQGGVDAIDLDSGRLLWQSDRAAKPLLCHEDLVVAQTEPPNGQQFLRIALLNTREITAEARFVDIPLPADVWATIEDQMESSFSAAARIHERAVVLSWRYTYRRVTGPPPGPDDQTSDRETTGSVRIDIHTGQISPTHEVAAQSEPELPPGGTRLKGAQVPAGPVWRVGKVLVSVERTNHEGRQRVTLQRWDAETGEALADVTLFDGGLNFRSVSADKRHLLASRRDASDSRTWEWTVYSLETGAKVAELRHDTPAAWFFISGSRLIYDANVTSQLDGGQVVLGPRKLHAVALETGTEVWSHAVRDTSYRGPYPPGTGR